MRRSRAFTWAAKLRACSACAEAIRRSNSRREEESRGGGEEGEEDWTGMSLRERNMVRGSRIAGKVVEVCREAVGMVASGREDVRVVKGGLEARHAATIW